MTKTVVVLGSTGKQGGAVIDAFLNDPKYKVRALSRNAQSESAKELSKKGVEVVEGETSDEASLVKAFKGANIIYAVTADLSVTFMHYFGNNIPDAVHKSFQSELFQGQNLIRAVETAFTAATLDLFIFSGLSAAKKISHGEFQRVYHFDGKSETVEYLESRWADKHPDYLDKTAVLQLGMFVTNSKAPTPMSAKKQSDGRYRVTMPCSINTNIPFINPEEDPGHFVRAIVAASDSHSLLGPVGERKVRQFAGYGKTTSWADWVKWVSKYTGEEVYFHEISIEDWGKQTAMPEFGYELAEMWKYADKVGYFGGDEKRGSYHKITTLKLEKEPKDIETWVKEQGKALLFEDE